MTISSLRNGDGFIAHAFWQGVGELVTIHGNGHVILYLFPWNHSQAVGVNLSRILIGADVCTRRCQLFPSVGVERNRYRRVVPVVGQGIGESEIVTPERGAMTVSSPCGMVMGSLLMPSGKG